MYDAVSTVMTMASDGQQEVNKRLEIKNISFEQKKVGDYEYVKDKISIYPNPLSTSSQLSFYTESLSRCVIEIYSLTGSLVKTIEPKSVLGYNQIEIRKGSLVSGLYYLRLRTEKKTFYAIQLLVY